VKKTNLKNIFLMIFGMIFIIQSCTTTNTTTTTLSDGKGWEQVSKILEQIKAPIFPDKDFPVTDFGAVGDGSTECTEAFKKAIDKCSNDGGGRVIVPDGLYLTGAIRLKSNVNLHIKEGATILFSTDIKKYLPLVYTRFEGVECYNFSPFIYAYEQENIAITGKGKIDGQGSYETWWPWKGREEHGWDEGKPNGIESTQKLFKYAEDGVPVTERIFGEGNYLRTNFIQPYKCKNVLIDSITINRSPMWVIHPVLCENVTVQNVKVVSHGPNNDGCNPESSKNVLIKNCYFDTGDDCIAIKSGRNEDGRRVDVPSENIVIQNCTMRDGHGGVVIGSEISGNVRNVFAEDCVMDSPNLERVLRIKTNSRRGGVVENIFMRNITVGEVSRSVITVNFYYGEGDVGDFLPVVKNIYVDNIQSKKSPLALNIRGYERSPITNLFLQNCKFDGVKEGVHMEHYMNLTMKEVYINGKLQ